MIYSSIRRPHHWWYFLREELPAVNLINKKTIIKDEKDLWRSRFTLNNRSSASNTLFYFSPNPAT
jgi:hypothetical protein